MHARALSFFVQGQTRLGAWKGRQGMSEPMSGGLKRKVSLSGSLSLHLDLGFRDLTKTWIIGGKLVIQAHAVKRENRANKGTFFLPSRWIQNQVSKFKFCFRELTSVYVLLLPQLTVSRAAWLVWTQHQQEMSSLNLNFSLQACSEPWHSIPLVPPSSATVLV